MVTSNDDGELKLFRTAMSLRPRLHDEISRIVGNRADAQEVFQSTLLQLVLVDRKRNDVHSPEAYVQTVARNKAFDFLRDKNREKKLEHGLQAYAEVLRDASAASNFDVLSSEQEVDAMARLINSLPEKCRLVFWLCRIEGYSHAEVSEMLGISRGCVKKRLATAVVKVSQAMDGAVSS